MQTSNSIDNILASLKPDVINVKYLFDGATKILQMPGNSDIADLQTKLLEVCHKLLYEINDIRIKDGAIAGSDELPFYTLLSSIPDIESIVFQVDDRIKNDAGKFIESQYNANYINYLQGKEDEKLAKQLQEDDYEDDFTNVDINRLRESVQRLQESMMQRIDHASISQLQAIRAMINSWSHLGVPPNENVLTQIEQRLATTAPPPSAVQSPTTAPHVMQLVPGLFAVFGAGDATIAPNASANEDDSDDDQDDQDDVIIPEPSPTMDPLFNNIMRLVRGQRFEDVKVVNTKEEIDTLKNMKYFELKAITTIHKEGKPCDICLDEYENNDNILLLTCNHYYHDHCIKKWLENNSNRCPICKASVLKGKPMISE